MAIDNNRPLLRVSFLARFFHLTGRGNIRAAISATKRPFSSRRPFVSGFGGLLRIASLFVLSVGRVSSRGRGGLANGSGGGVLRVTHCLSSTNGSV